MELTKASAIELLDDLDLAIEKLTGRAIDRFYGTPEDRQAYAKHLELFAAGGQFRLRALLGGNRTGKSVAGCYELACHLTGEYPEWWVGLRFTRPILAWAGGTSKEQVRDILQTKLIGVFSAPGTGLIPRESILEVRKRPGIPDLMDIVRIQHASGGVSELQFKSYQEGREAWQGRRVDYILMDEECDWPIFEEALLRTASTSKSEAPGRITATFTPLSGLTKVAEHFLDDGHTTASGNRFSITMAWDECPHLSRVEQAELEESIPRHQRDARMRGIPVLGVGAVYQYSEADLVCEAFPVPGYYFCAYGLDLGWNCTAAVFIRYNPDSKVFYVVDEHRQGHQSPADHAAAIRAKAPEWWGAIDPSSRGRGQLDGKALFDEYRDLGLRLKEAANAVEAGTHRVQMLMSTGRLKVFPNCTGLLAELRKYSRNENGQIRKQDDHLLDAMRYALFTDRVFHPTTPWKPPKVTTGLAVRMRQSGWQH